MLFIFQAAGTNICSNRSQNATHTGLKMMLAFVGEAGGCHGVGTGISGHLSSIVPQPQPHSSVRQSDGVNWESTMTK